MQNMSNTIVIGLVLMLGPALRASAAEPAAPSMRDLDQRATLAQTSDVELEALDDTLDYDQRRFAQPNDTSGTLTLRGAPRTTGSAVESELGALTQATLAENSSHGIASYAFTWDDGLGRDVPAAESELHALLAWQDAEHDAGSAGAAPQKDAVAQQAAPANRTTSVSPEALASDAHDDSGISPGGAFDSNLGAGASPNREGEKPQSASASAQDPHAAASDDCTCM